MELLNTIDLSLSVIGITETWLKKPNSESTNVFIEGYNFIHNSREDKIGGGVGFFIENNTQYKQRHDLDFFDHQVFESMFESMFESRKKRIIILLKQITKCIMSVFLSKLFLKNKPSYIGNHG